MDRRVNCRMFDVEVTGLTNRYFSMQELMATYEDCKRRRNWDAAKDVLEYAAECGHLPAKLELARLLKNTPLDSIPQAQRFARAETLYLELLNIFDLPSKAIAQISLELSDLYGDCMSRPIGCLASMLKAKRLGSNVSERSLELCRQRLSRMDINSFGNNARDAFDLGTELNLAGGSTRMTELFLREAAETEENPLCGLACLALADFYDEHKAECQTYRTEALHYYQLADKYGFPEYIKRRQAY